MKSKNQLIILVAVIMGLSCEHSLMAQTRQRIAVISVDTKGMNVDNETMTSLVNLELERSNRFELMDKYDVSDMLKKNEIDHNSCFGKSCLVRVGKLLKVDKMITGSVEKFGNKIVMIFKIVDIAAESIEISNVMEYIDHQNELQMMVRMSVNNLFGIPNDQKIMDLLVNYQQPISSPKTIVKLNGPRMGASYTFGEYGKRMSASTASGGFNMYPITSMFGYQFEKQYLSAGDFQALIEMVLAINGMESGTFSPSITLLNGFRFNKKGWEIGLGPVFRLTKLARGYYDENGEWKLQKEHYYESLNYDVVETIDYRGVSKVHTGLIFAAGKTFRSGYLNIPLNLYVSPRKEGTVIGMTFGFNIAKMPKNWQ
jgi:hypothetical protein